MLESDQPPLPAWRKAPPQGPKEPEDLRSRDYEDIHIRNEAEDSFDFADQYLETFT